MSKVIAFPGPYVNHRTRGLAVVVAPHVGGITAWVKTARGWLILERTPDYEHALADGRRYASRFGLPIEVQDHPLGIGSPASGAVNGEIYITTSERDGGSWDVVHESRSGDTCAIVGNAFAFDQAVIVARAEAKRLGAVFHDGSSAA